MKVMKVGVVNNEQNEAEDGGRIYQRACLQSFPAECHPGHVLWPRETASSTSLQTEAK